LRKRTIGAAAILAAALALAIATAAPAEQPSPAGVVLHGGGPLPPGWDSDPAIFTDDPAIASGRQVPDPRAERILDAADASLAGKPDAEEPTQALRHVAQILPRLEGDQEERAERMLARPTNHPDRDGYAYNAPVSFAFSNHFCFFYTLTGEDAVSPADTNANGYPDFIDATAGFAEFSFRDEHGRLAFNRPLGDGARGCRPGKIDIYLVELSRDQAYGIAIAEPKPRQLRSTAYMLVDRNMAEFGYSNRLQPLAVTIAHEYGHVIQDGYDLYQDDWMAESTSTWLEEQVFPVVNDYINYMPAHQSVGVPLTDNNDIKQYANATFWHFLDSKFGNRIASKSWGFSLKTNPTEFAPLAIDRGIPRAGGFSREFINYAASVAEWRALGRYPDHELYPDIRRTGTLRPNASVHRAAFPHMTYKLFNVPVTKNKITLLAQTPRGVTGGLALVGRSGAARTGNVVIVTDLIPNGGIGKVVLRGARRFRRITAVIVNADFSQVGYDNNRGDWVWSGDSLIKFVAG
jgi:hypothetical protein